MDPSRVLDLIIDAYALRPQRQFNISLYDELLRKFAFPPETVASIVGFKLTGLGKDEQASEIVSGMMHCVARLISEGFCTLEAIYPYLCPVNDDETANEISDMRKKIKNAPPPIGRGSGTDLAVEHQPCAHDATLEVQCIISGITNQKILLTAYLLEMDQVECARIFLEKFPGLAIVPAVGRSICSFIKKKFSSLDNPTLQYWLEQVQSGLYLDPSLMIKLCRAGKQRMTAEPDFWLAIVLEYLLPALTIVSPNPALAFELWDLISLYPYTKRFALYGKWRSVELHEKYPTCAFAKTIVSSDVRKVMRRLTKDNVKQYGRLLAKLCHSNPVIVLPVILEQLQAYDNLIQPVVDALKYLTPLGFDVLSFVLVDCLANPSKDRLKEDGTNLSTWLQGLALFTGSLYRRYYNVVDPTGILTYLGKQMLDDSSFDLMVLSELLYRMGGVETGSNLSEAHVEALAGGVVLRAEVTLNETLQHQLKSIKKVSGKLVEVLIKSELLIPLWILLGQQRNTAIFTGDHTHVKLLCTLLDMGRKVLLQYTKLIENSIREGLLTELNFDSLPSFNELVTCFALPEDIAHLMRRTWSRAFQRSNNDSYNTFESLFCSGELCDLHVPSSRYTSECMRLKTILSSAAPPSIEPAMVTRWKKDRERAPQVILTLEAEHREQQENVKSFMGNIDRVKDELFADMITTTQMEALYLRTFFPRSVSSPADAMYTAKFILALLRRGVYNFSFIMFVDKLVSCMRSILSLMSEWEAHNFARFVELILAELSLRKSSEAHFNEIAELVGMQLLPEKTALTKQEEKKKVTGNGDELMVVHQKSTKDELIDMHVSSSDKCGEKSSKSMEQLVKNVSMMGVDGENSMIFDDQNDNESDNAVNFTNSGAGELTASTEAIGDPIGDTFPATAIATATTAANTTIATPAPVVSRKMSYEEFRDMCYKWHLLLHRAFISSLESGEYLSIKNSIIVLTRIAPYFPMMKKIGTSIKKTIGKIKGEEAREDLKVMAIRYFATLCIGEAKWMAENEFHHVPNSKMEVGEIIEFKSDQQKEQRPTSDTAIKSTGGESRKRERDRERNNSLTEEPIAKQSRAASPRSHHPTSNSDEKKPRQTDTYRSVRSIRRDDRIDRADRDREGEIRDRLERERERGREQREKEREREREQREREREREREKEREQREREREQRERGMIQKGNRDREVRDTRRSRRW